MKLKRLLAGALAAAVAVSTIAVSAFTTSAADEPNTWIGKWGKSDTKVTYEQTGGALKGSDNGGWQLKVDGVDLSGMTKPMVHVEWENQDTIQIVANSDSSWGHMVTNGGSDNDYEISEENKDTAYLVSTVGSTGVITKVNFYDGANGNEPTSGNEPTEDPGPVEEAITSVEYYFTVDSVTNVDSISFTMQNSTWATFVAETAIDGTGDYTAKATGINGTVVNLGFIPDSLGEGSSIKITVNKIVVNDKYEITVNAPVESPSATGNGLANIWNDAGKADVVYTPGDGYYLAGDGGTSIKLMVGGDVEDPTEDPTEEPTGEPAPTTSYPAFYGFVDGDWSVNSQNDQNGAVKFESYPAGYADYITAPDITGDGTYTYTLDMEGLRGLAEYKPGCMVWTIDFKNLAKDLGIKPEDGDERSAAEIAKSKGFIIKDVTISIDPDDNEFGLKDYVIPNDLLIYGDVESQNDDARIEIYNEYGTSKTAYPEEFISYVSEMDPESLISVTFTIEGMDAILKGDTPTPPPAEEADTTAYDKAMEDALATLDKSSDYCYEGVVTLASIAGIAKGAVDVAAEQYAAGEMTLEQYQDVLDTAAAEIQEAIGALIPAADANVTITFTADKAYAKPGDEVTYTVHVDTKVVPLHTLQFRVAFPEGMTYVAGSGALIEGINDTLGYDVPLAVTETADGTIFINGCGSAPNSVESFDLATFKCVVNDGVADGTVLDVTADYVPAAPYENQYPEFSGSDYQPIDNIAIVAAAVTVGEPTDEPTDEPATEEPTDTTKAPSDNGNNSGTDKPSDNGNNSGTDKPADNNGGNNNGGANNGGSNNGGASDAQPNTGAATAVGLSIFMAAGLAGAVAIKRRRK